MTEKSQHFLVVDDDADSREVIVEYLRSMGYSRITVASDGAEAIRVLDRDPSVSFIVSDWDMPLLNGLNLLQRVRAHKTRSHLPFLIATSPVSLETEKIVLAAENSVDAYIIKPFRSQTFRQKIEGMLELSVHGPQKQALVVDDDADARAMLVEYLGKLGFRDVHAAEDGRAALAQLARNHAGIGLIVSDWEMPEVNGMELLRACKQNAAFSAIPFLMVTSQGSMERMKVLQAARSSVDQYLLKPFVAADLKKRVDQMLAKSRNRQEVEALTAAAQEHFEHGRLPRAQLAFEGALALDPECDPALRGLGDTLLKLKGVESALPHYKKAVEANPLSVRSYLRLASAYEQLGWVEKALSLLLTGNQLISFSADLHFHLGRIYNKKGMTQEARIQFEKTIELQLDHQEARLMLEMLKPHGQE